MKQKQITTILLVAINVVTYAQNVVISEVESVADASAIMDIQSTDKGMLIPRLTEVQRTAISNPATGLTVFQTDGSDGFYFYNGSAWISLFAGSEQDPIFSGSEAASVTDSGSGKIITDPERDSLKNAIVSTSKGVSFPQMTIAERNAITSPEEGFMIYQTDNTPGVRVYDGTDWRLLNPRVAFLKDIKSAGVEGGASVFESYITRDLNSIEGYQGFFTSQLSNNQFTLEPGTYLIEARAPAYSVSQHQLRLTEVGSGVATNSDGNPFYGESHYSQNSTNGLNWATLKGEIKISSATTFSIDHWTRTIYSNGLGVAYTARGNPEIYTNVKITKIAD